MDARDGGKNWVGNFFLGRKRGEFLVGISDLGFG
jgi:hypothetical protein